MKLSGRAIASFAGVAVLAAAIVASFMLLGSGVPVQPGQADVIAGLGAGTIAEPAAADGAQLPEQILSCDFAVVYTSVGQLKSVSDLVVRGEVTDVSYLDFNTVVYTKLTLTVAKCFKGDAGVGDEVTILEPGGITTQAYVVGDKFGGPTKADTETKVKVLVDGAPLTQLGDTCLFFLGTGDISVVPGTYYVPMGSFQGRFKIDNGAAKRFVPADWGSKYTSLSMDESTVDSTVAQAAGQ